LASFSTVPRLREQFHQTVLNGQVTEFFGLTPGCPHKGYQQPLEG